MKKQSLLLLVAGIAVACTNSDNVPATAVELPLVEKPLVVEQPEIALDTTPRITGIGGIFFRSPQPDSIKSWYGKNLGLATDKYGSVFEFRNANSPEDINYLRWSAFVESTDYLAPSNKDYMINYRVFGIDRLVENLEANGVNMLDSVVDYGYGKFVHFVDPDGTKVELWEPVDSVLTKLGGPTTK